MAIDVSKHGSITVTGEDIYTYRRLAIMHGLALEVATTLKAKSGVSMLKLAKQEGMTTKNTKAGALVEVVEFMRKTYGIEPKPSVQRALDKIKEKKGK